MIRFYFCEAFKEKINGKSFMDNIINKINEYSNYSDLRNIEEFSYFKDNIFVLKILKPKAIVIIEKKRISFDNNENTVFFVRDIILGQSVDYIYSKAILPQLKSRIWKNNNKIPNIDIENLIEELRGENYRTKELKFPPQEYTSWFNDFKLQLDNEIFETKEWVVYALNNSKTEGMTDFFAEPFRIILEKIINEKVNCEAIYRINNINVCKYEESNYGIIYSRIELGNDKIIYLLFNGAHTINQKERWLEILKTKPEYSLQSNIDIISRLSFRAYPKWTVKHSDLWFAIQNSNEISNLSLTSEQIDFFHHFKFPYYINGQAGSGKSTMLYYIFSNAYYYKCLGEIKGELLFLTENKNLLENTKNSIIELLNNNPEFEGLSIEHKSDINKYFYSFKDFLISLLPSNDKLMFPIKKYLSFSIFKTLYEDSNFPNTVINNYSAEEIWFVIITYIYGYKIDKIITSKEYEQEIDRDAKIIPLDKFKYIEDKILPFYNRLINEEGYWDKLKIIRFINKNNIQTKKYSVLICDEAQDFCKVELNFILKLSEFLKYDLSKTKQVPIVFAGDPNQTVNPTGFRQDEMTSMLYKELKLISKFDYKPKERIYNPKYNYRSVQPVVSLANFIQFHRMKKLGITQIEPQEAKRPDYDINYNFNIFLNYDEITADNSLETDLLEKVEYKVFIIPVDSQEKESYIKKHTFLLKLKETEIKTSVEAKGAEYEQVVLYGFGEYFLKQHNELTVDKLEVDEQFKRRYYFNKLYVGVTRAQTELIIIDSVESKDKFWKKLVEESDISVNNWSILNNFKENTTEYHTGSVRHIMQSTIENAEENAKRDKKQGLYDENPARLKVAANQFIKLGNKKEGYECLALSEELKENWKAAANYYLRPELNNEKLEEASTCLLKGRFFSEIINFEYNLKTIEQDIRKIISRIFYKSPLMKLDINILNENTEVFSKIINDLDWKEELANEFILQAKRIEFNDYKKILISITEAVLPIIDKNIWVEIGYIYYELKDYHKVVKSWDRIDFFDNVEYTNAQLFIAKQSGKNEDVVLWLDELLRYKELKEHNEIYSEITNIYSNNHNKVNNKYFYLISYKAMINQQHIDKIAELGKEAERRYNNSLVELESFYKNIIKPEFNESIIIYIIERWAKTLWKINKNNTDWIVNFNANYKILAKDFELPFVEYTIDELKNISEYPEAIQKTPPKHITNITVKNFRQFKRLSISNISKFNLIVGDNNVGKTSILEALLFSDDFNMFIKNLIFAYIDRKNISKFIIDNKEQYLINYNEILNDFYKKETKIKEISYEISAKRKKWKYEIRNSTSDEINREIGLLDNIDNSEFITVISNEKLIKIVELKLLSRKLEPSSSVKSPLIPFGKGYDVDLAKAYYDEIDRNKIIRETFLESIKTFIPNVSRVNADTDSGQIDIEEFGLEEPTSLHQYGEGANKLFRILVQISLQKGNRLLIDEIDAGIHYSRFSTFWKTIIKAAKFNNVQIFATTHNIECVKYFSNILKEEDYIVNQSESRVITFENLPNDEVKAFTRTFKEFDYELNNDFEIRGGDL